MRAGVSLIDKPADARLADLLESGPYFTDGLDLFRVVSVTSDAGGPRLVELEDCRTLKSSVYVGNALMTLGLEPVRAEHALEVSS
jgi:hypothetical protein